MESGCNADRGSVTLVLLDFIVREGREALEKTSGHDGCDCDDDD